MNSDFRKLMDSKKDLDRRFFDAATPARIQNAIDSVLKLRESHDLGDLWVRVVQRRGEWFLECVSARRGYVARIRIPIIVEDPTNPLSTVGDRPEPAPMNLAVELFAGDARSLRGTWPNQGKIASDAVIEVEYPGCIIEVPYEAAKALMPHSRTGHSS